MEMSNPSSPTDSGSQPFNFQEIAKGFLENFKETIFSNQGLRATFERELRDTIFNDSGLRDKFIRQLEESIKNDPLLIQHFKDELARHIEITYAPQIYSKIIAQKTAEVESQIRTFEEVPDRSSDNIATQVQVPVVQEIEEIRVELAPLDELGQFLAEAKNSSDKDINLKPQREYPPGIFMALSSGGKNEPQKNEQVKKNKPKNNKPKKTDTNKSTQKKKRERSPDVERADASSTPKKNNRWTITGFCGDQDCKCTYTRTSHADAAMNDVSLISQHRLYITGLPDDVDNMQLRKELGELCRPHSTFPESTYVGTYYGARCGILQFRTHVDAVKAYNGLSGKKIQGNRLTVNFYRK